MQIGFTITTILIMLFFCVFQSDKIKKGQSINHIKHFLLFCLSIFLMVILLFDVDKISFAWWIFHCSVFTIFIRGAMYDYMLNLLRGKSIGYVSPRADGIYTGTNESWYDDMLHRFQINQNVLRIVCIFLSIIWYFIL
jgi:hypothetical protein